MPTSITINGLDKVYEKLDRFAAGKYLQKPMREAVNLIHARIATYPPKPTGESQGFASDKQRRFFFAALRSGEITLPYRRTGQLSRSWTSQIDDKADGITGTVGTNLDYAPWVQSVEEIGGRGPQAKIHQGRWETDESVVTALKTKIVETFKNAIDKLME